MAAPVGASTQACPSCWTCVASSHFFPPTSTTLPRNLALSRGQLALPWSLTFPVGSGRQNIPVHPGRRFLSWTSTTLAALDIFFVVSKLWGIYIERLIVSPTETGLKDRSNGVDKSKSDIFKSFFVFLGSPEARDPCICCCFPQTADRKKIDQSCSGHI